MILIRAALRKLMQADEEMTRIHEAMLEIARDVSAKNVLDVGCGNAGWVLELARRMGIDRSQVFGIEVNRSAAEAARKEIKVFEIDLEASRWPFKDQSLDLVVMDQVLEHLKNIYLNLAEAERVVAVGGHLAVGVPNLSGLVNRLRLLAGKQPMCVEIDGPHVRGFAESSFLQFLAANPAFMVKRVWGSSLYPLPWPLLEPAARIFPQLACYSFFLLQKTAHRSSSAWIAAAERIGASNFAR